MWWINKKHKKRSIISAIIMGLSFFGWTVYTYGLFSPTQKEFWFMVLVSVFCGAFNLFVANYVFYRMYRAWGKKDE